jgi:hypothetical protein
MRSATRKRSPCLQRELAPLFDLVAVEAPLETLVNRIAARARYDEPDEFVRQKEAARRMILGESGQDEPAHGHDIKTCIAMADWKLDNSTSLAVLSAGTEGLHLGPHPAARRATNQREEAMTRRISIGTGGGDAPGLNAVIRAVTLAALEAGLGVSRASATATTAC